MRVVKHKHNYRSCKYYMYMYVYVTTVNVSSHSNLHECTTLRTHTGNPLEEKHSAEGDWRDQVQGKLKKLKKLDGNICYMLMYSHAFSRYVQRPCFVPLNCSIATCMMMSTTSHVHVAAQQTVVRLV